MFCSWEQAVCIKFIPRARNDYVEETVYDSYMEPEPGFQSGLGGSADVDWMGTLSAQHTPSHGHSTAFYDTIGSTQGPQWMCG